MNNRKTKHASIVLLAIITAIIFAVVLYLALNPTVFYKLTRQSNQSFDTTQDFVKFMDVAQGDSALIYSNGYSAVIDVGEIQTANDVATDLYDCNINVINALLISHLHSDHVSGLPRIAELFKIENLIMPEISQDSIISAQNGREIAINKGAKFYNAKQGINYNIGEFEITLLSAFDNKKNENNRSLFVMAEIDGIKFLFTGDAETSAEKKLLEENLNIDCDVLKVSHHGSNTSTSNPLLKATTPEYAVISVGEGNSYHHPHDKTLNSLKNSGAKIFRTDENGDITFNIKNKKITVKTEK